jgi:hypothetical protein
VCHSFIPKFLTHKTETFDFHFQNAFDTSFSVIILSCGSVSKDPLSLSLVTLYFVWLI